MAREEQMEIHLGLNFEHDKTNIIHWMPTECCHWWNKYISFTLAKLVFPDYSWQLMGNENHTTVICLDHELIFDMVAYAWDSNKIVRASSGEIFIDEENCAKEVCDFIGLKISSKLTKRK